jgi:thioredoxin-like negative regulator of GroEL
MKKTIGLSISCIIVIAAGYLFFRGYAHVQSREQRRLAIRTLPELPFEIIKRATFSEGGEPTYTIVYFFSPECQHCQYMTKDILQHAKAFDGCHMIMVSLESKDSVIAFMHRFELSTMPFISVAVDTAARFPVLFGTTTIPSIYIYKNDKLVKAFTGETNVQNILASIP